MKINGKAHCFFEQSGTFKQEFIKLGIPSEDYDIQNNFGQTDHVIDLFAEIEKAYSGGVSCFDAITPDDLILAFFPCIYFESLQQTEYSLESINQRAMTINQRIQRARKRLENRTYFHDLLYKLLGVVYDRGLRLIIENPATAPNYLITGQNFPPPTIIDKNRMLRGDYFVKPTAYWFINCEPTYGFSKQQDKEQKIIGRCKGGVRAGICSEERSMISPDYARNFICDFILGKEQQHSQKSLFDL